MMRAIAAQQDIATSGEGKDSHCKVLAMKIEREASWSLLPHSFG
jgi:hypothetical protein